AGARRLRAARRATFGASSRHTGQRDAIHGRRRRRALCLLPARHRFDRDPGPAGSAMHALVLAHSLAGEALRQWDVAPLVVVPLAATLTLYVAGLARVWRRAGVGKGVSCWSALSFAAGWVTLFV